ncbi:MAG TPA: Rrf2 family transcriptional regulator [Candidatus Aerophobetes bacterium]|uniref:Rrf2 family transcriptional regulator n=1 Tax=Aerophobetes bacterium TaxID=2030807 RepID=A0A7V5HZ86_UNCAE|nr:Rrf2 family transcriptional regulator [Candidatus Aerophobetes bacterium]
MKLSTKGRYGARAMVDMALHEDQAPILLKDIAKRQGISEKYLEHIITSLKVAGLVKSIRGARGGYILARPASQIKLSHIIRALEGSAAPVECVDDPKLCSRVGICVTRDVWMKIKEKIEEILESVSLKDLAEQQKKKQEEGLTYYI